MAKYKVGKGCIMDSTAGTVYPILIKIGEEIPEVIIENYKKNGSLDNLIADGTIVEATVDLTEVKKIYQDADKKSKVEEIMEEVNKRDSALKKDEKKENK